MLYDPKWEVEVKADPFSLDSLIAWLEKQPADEKYCYLDHGRCLLGQYFAAMGFQNVAVYSCGNFSHAGRNSDRYPKSWDGEIACMTGGETFGAALGRARKLRNAQTSC